MNNEFLLKFNFKSAGHLKVGESIMTRTSNKNCHSLLKTMECFKGWKVKTSVVHVYPHSEPLNGFKAVVVERIK